MPLEDVVLPKQYRNARVLFEQHLDAWRLASQDAFANNNLNLKQIALDCFGVAYDFDNDGQANLSTSILDLINNISAGGSPITATASSTWTIGTGSIPGTLDMGLLTAPRNYQFPDISGIVLLNNGEQSVGDMDFTQKAFSIGSPNILRLAGGAHTTLAAGTEAPDIVFNLARTVQFSQGAIANQRAFQLLAPTYSMAGGPATITTAATWYIDNAPQVGANCTITNSYAFLINAGAFKSNGPIIPGFLNKGDLSGAQTIDWRAANTQRIRAIGGLSLSFLGQDSFQVLRLIIQQDGSGSRLVTWPANIRWMNGTGANNSITDAPTLTTTANKFDVFSFYWDSVLNLFIGSVVGFNGAIS
jgi:hypothetical protein